MKKIIFSFVITFLFISCKGLPVEPYVSKELPVAKPEKPELPVYIMGKGNVSADLLAVFLSQNNPKVDIDFAMMTAKNYIDEAAFEGVNHDIAFVQMCLETGFLRFGGDVKREQNNFCGLGAIGNGEPGLSFSEPLLGVRAHIQHLKAYGSTEPLKGELINPRFRFVQRGRAPTYEGLAGTWAADKQYAEKIKSILNRLYEFAFS
ncbi:MAG: glucosaminidase domain-containing protein [Treponema sp.]|nr:glucosaminidase domain-containing protein [Treponema sp.]MCL2252499.1 glucosaminidase domain-containing protein [Treponema sp.]